MSSWEKMLQGGCPISPEERARLKGSAPSSSSSGSTDTNANAKATPPAAAAATATAKTAAAVADPTGSACGSDEVNPANQMAVQERQKPAPDQRLPLSTERVVSTIPKAEFTPAHQEQGNSSWEYPSEQMFYNAMRRKGWQPDEKDMSVVVAMHNAVNERSWKQVMMWEKLHECDCANPKLKKFLGRPKDVSPKARLRNLFGYALPFDRHDWIVDRCGQEVRYVVDFYAADPKQSGAGFFIDARPALDSFTNVWDRVRMSFHKLLK